MDHEAVRIWVDKNLLEAMFIVAWLRDHKVTDCFDAFSYIKHAFTCSIEGDVPHNHDHANVNNNYISRAYPLGLYSWWAPVGICHRFLSLEILLYLVSVVDIEVTWMDMSGLQSRPYASFPKQIVNRFRLLLSWAFSFTLIGIATFAAFTSFRAGLRVN